jgi:hypothetical protein
MTDGIVLQFIIMVIHGGFHNKVSSLLRTLQQHVAGSPSSAVPFADTHQSPQNS